MGRKCYRVDEEIEESVVREAKALKRCGKGSKIMINKKFRAKLQKSRDKVDGRMWSGRVRSIFLGLVGW